MEGKRGDLGRMGREEGVTASGRGAKGREGEERKGTGMRKRGKRGRKVGTGPPIG